MARIKQIFLDDGDVMNDNAVRGPQWRRLVGEFFVPLLGGTYGAWAAANLSTVPDVDARFWERLQAGQPYSDSFREYGIDWLESMCRSVGLPAPAESDCRELARAASKYITRRVRAAYPGAVEAIRDLGGTYQLFTASNEFSADIESYLEGMGVSELFCGFYGADLVEATKPSVDYYERMFVHAGVDARSSLVVDDKPEFLVAAAAAGAQVIAVRRDGLAPEGMAWVLSLAELPERLRGGLLE